MRLASAKAVRGFRSQSRQRSSARSLWARRWQSADMASAFFARRSFRCAPLRIHTRRRAESERCPSAFDCVVARARAAGRECLRANAYANLQFKEARDRGVDPQAIGAKRFPWPLVDIDHRFIGDDLALKADDATSPGVDVMRSTGIAIGAVRPDLHVAGVRGALVSELHPAILSHRRRARRPPALRPIRDRVMGSRQRALHHGDDQPFEMELRRHVDTRRGVPRRLA